MKAEWTNKDSLSIESTGKKAVLVIDMPSDCAECQFCGWGGRNLEKYVCSLTREHSEEPHLVGCPLKLMPEKKEPSIQLSIRHNDEPMETLGFRCTEYENGWNDCLEELEK